MRFSSPRRRHPPAVIIVSMIDILLVVLIFMMVTTTFKQQPALKLALPESQQAKPGATEANVVITIASQEPYFYLGKLPITTDRLQSELQARVARNPQLQLAIKGDKGAPFGQVIKVIDLAKVAKIKYVSAVVIPTAAQP